MKIRLLPLMFACLLLPCPAAVAQQTETLQLPMPDGVHLTTDLHLPEGEGPWPVILARSTYGRVGINAAELNSRGYAVVVQDVRGMGESEGEAHVFYAEGWRPGYTDGAETVAWIRAQDWCNGEVGTIGGSALGITQMLLAGSGAELDAQDIEVAPADFYREAVYPGGVFRKNMLEGWLTMIQQPHLIELYKNHPYYDDYWRYLNANERVEASTAPALFIGGWQDIFAQGTINAFVEREERGGPGARGNNLLVMKWSTHGPDIDTYYKFHENRFDLKISELRRAFMDHWLLGEPEELDLPKVHYYVFGADTEGAPGNTWRTAAQWPPLPTEQRTYYLHQDGVLRETAPTEEGGGQSFRFDPANPVPTYGGANLLQPSGPFDQREISRRDDVLRFYSPVLEQPLEVVGRMTARLYISTDAPDTDFTAKLVDVYPEGDGREILLVDAMRRVKLRDGFEAPAPLLESAEEIVELEIDLHSIAWVFNTGHRIGLHISSSNFPRFEVNPNTGADFPTEGGERSTAQNRVHMDASHPSALLLPVSVAAGDDSVSQNAEAEE